LFSESEPRVGFILGTGPSLTNWQLSQIKPYRKFGVNNAYQWTDLDVHLACNPEWWDYYHQDISEYDCQKWTWHQPTADKYGVNHISGRWHDGLSTDNRFIHYHHGAGPQMVNLALHYGVKVMCLLGWDMHYPGKLDNHTYLKPRHKHGEYPEELQHWPKTGPNGEFTGLIKEMETIHPREYDIEIINCTPGSALQCFPQMKLSQFISEYLTRS
jgi:hypothetical protein